MHTPYSRGDKPNLESTNIYLSFSCVIYGSHGPFLGRTLLVFTEALKFYDGIVESTAC